MKKNLLYWSIIAISIVLAISLEATDMGRASYEKYGFVSMKDEMEFIF